MPTRAPVVFSEPGEARVSTRLQDLVTSSWPWAVVAVLLGPIVIGTRADPDLWGHLRFGLDILHTRTIPVADPYSFTQDLPWINHEWLSEVVLAAVYQAWGSAGLVALKGIIFVACFAIAASALRRAWPPAAGALVLLVGWAFLPFRTVRPQLWTFLGVAALCRMFLARPARWWLAAVPLMFLVWSNLHGGWIVGAMLLAIWTGSAVVRRDRPGLAAAVAVLSALATLINPYGWHLWRFLAGTVRLTRDIEEWQPLFQMSAPYWVPWVVTVLLLIAAAATRKRRWDRLLMIAVLLYGSARVRRLTGLCVEAAPILLSDAVERWSALVPRRWWKLQTPSLAASLVLVGPPTAATLLTIGHLVQPTARCVELSGDWVPDPLPIPALRGSEGRMVTWFNWGEYAIWHLGPRLQVSLDGRRETVYSDAVLSAHSALYRAAHEGLAYLARLDPEYVWLPAHLASVRDWLTTHGYRIDVQTPHSFVAVRADMPRLTPPGNAAGRTQCFPAP